MTSPADRRPTSAPSPPRVTVNDHRPLEWSESIERLVESRCRDWLDEDLGHECDWTSVALVPADASAALDVVARRPGVFAGSRVAALVARAVDPRLEWTPLAADGDRVERGTVIARVAGPTRTVLTAERTVLNVLGRMSGVATATRRLVDAVAGTACQVYDTRKTVPGWRILDKLAARAGGGMTHRLGLYDAILVKDNHLGAFAAAGGDPAAAVRRAREFVARSFPAARAAQMVVEIELDDVASLPAVLAAGPDIVLLDNMGPAQIAEGVAIRDRLRPGTILEASGGVSPETAGALAATGVDRISSGWPTHGAPWLDIALDWKAD